MPSLYPLRFVPVYKNYLWGGRRLETVLRRQLEPGQIYAESWEISDHPHGQSVVQFGPLAPATLHELVEKQGAELFGRHHPQDRFPLLIKFLDANQSLSVQVHPDDETAARMGLSDPGKTEAWVVLDARPGSVIWSGFSRPVDRDTLRRAIREGKIERYLGRYEPAVGECLFLPAGTVHALGEGLMVAEIQQTSDNTFRLFDWNRPGQDGKPRPLHIDEALYAIDYGQPALKPQRPQETGQAGLQRLVACDRFVLDRWTTSSPQSMGHDGRFHILIVISGAVRIEGDPSDRPLGLGETALLPAAIGPVRLTPIEDKPAVFLDAYLP